MNNHCLKDIFIQPSVLQLFTNGQQCLIWILESPASSFSLTSGSSCVDHDPGRREIIPVPSESALWLPVVVILEDNFDAPTPRPAFESPSTLSTDAGKVGDAPILSGEEAKPEISKLDDGIDYAEGNEIGNSCVSSYIAISSITALSSELLQNHRHSCHRPSPEKAGLQRDSTQGNLILVTARWCWSVQRLERVLLTESNLARPPCGRPSDSYIWE